MLLTRYKNTFKTKVLTTAQAVGGAVVLRSDLNDCGESRQVSRALKALVEDGELIKFGYGVYVKAEKTPYSDKPIIVVSMAQACAEALNRLGIRWQLGQSMKDYNKGKTQQVPTKFIVRLKDRFRGQLGIGGRKIVFDRGINAR